MTLQIHGIVKQPQDIDGFFSLGATHPNHHEVTAFASLTGDVKSQNTFADVITFFGSVDHRTGRQVFQGRGECIGIGECLRLTKMVQCPAQNFTIVRPGAGGEANCPVISAHGVPMISEVIAVKCRSSVSCDVKL